LVIEKFLCFSPVFFGTHAVPSMQKNICLCIIREFCVSLHFNAKINQL